MNLTHNKSIYKAILSAIRVGEKNMLDECLISILQYLIDNSNNPHLSVLSSYIVIVEIILYYHPNDTVALEEMNREENRCHD